jgi:hypothetical protein
VKAGGVQAIDDRARALVRPRQSATATDMAR